MSTIPANRVQAHAKWLTALLVGAAALVATAERAEAATVRNYHVDYFAFGRWHRWTFRNYNEAAQAYQYTLQNYHRRFTHEDVEVADFPNRTADPLGRNGGRWVEEEGGQHSGVFIRRGNSNVFDATWGGGTHRAVLTMTVSGNTVRIRRVNLQGKHDGDYVGTLHGNGTVSGTYFGGKWSARIDP